MANSSSADLEKMILASLINRGKAITSDAIGMLGDNPFYFQEEDNQKIYALAYKTFTSGQEVSAMSMVEKIKSDPKLKKILPSFIPLIGANWYPDIKNGCLLLKEYYIRRKLQVDCMETVTKLMQSGDDIFEILNNHISIVNDLPKLATTTSESEPEDEFFKMLDHYTAVSEGRIPKGVNSGFRQLDYMTGGFKNNDMIVIGARPSMGKTAIAISMMCNMLKEGTSFGMLSLEMDTMQIYQRLTSALSGVPLRNIIDGTASDAQQDAMYAIKEKYIKNTHVIKSPNMPSINQIKAMVIDWKRKYDIKCLIIDYLAYIKPAKTNNREQEVAGISSGIKAIAKEFEIPVILLAQLNRGLEYRDDKRPILADLRESGSIEQDADIVLFLHRPEKYGVVTDKMGNSTLGKAELIVAKHRNGSLGTVNLFFEKDLTKFTDVRLN